MRCPHCGKDVDKYKDPNSPQGLLNHIKVQKQTHELHQERRVKQGRPKSESKEISIAKWQAWHDWVESKILEEQKGENHYETRVQRNPAK